MADQEAWTVGAAPECDILVDHPTVSGRHCRLTRNGAGFLLEDLDSTNGTFVNGSRITAPLSVTATDDIRLGPETPLPWEKIDHRLADQKVIRIGRSADNDVVLDYPNISGNHARIVVIDGQATIEDLGSTNGVAVGKPENLATKAALTESDTVYFGSLTVPAADLLHPDRVPAVVQSVPATAATAISPRTIAIAAAVLAVLVVAIGLAARQFSAEERRDQELPEDSTATDEVAVVEPPPPNGLATKIAAKPADAIYAVQVQNEGTNQLLRIGTAWAVGEHQLVTSGVVARYLEKYRQDLTAIQVKCAVQEKMFVVTRVDVHPEFKKAEKTIQQPAELAQAKRQKLEEIQSAKEPPSKEDVKKLVNELVDAEEQLFLAGEKMMFFDIGLLTVDKKIPLVLEIQKPGIKLAIESKTTLIGLPFDPESMGSAGKQAAETLPGKILQVAPPADDKKSPLRRLRVSSPADHHVQKEWRGSPVLNNAGAVIGVYVRPTPPVDPTKPLTGKSFDAVLIDQLNGLPVVPLALQKD